MSIIALVNMLLVANVLRATASWSVALVADVVVAVGLAIVAGVVFQNDLSLLMSDLTEILQLLHSKWSKSLCYLHLVVFWHGWLG